MKQTFFILTVALIGLISCKNDQQGVQEIKNSGTNAGLIRNPVGPDGALDTNQLARIHFAESEFDFGTANEGDVITHAFVFTNTGNVPLLIQNARSTCGCTIPEWPQEPIAPGASGKILAKFNTEGKEKFQEKRIYITANSYPNETSVLLKGNVTPSGK